MIGAGGERGGRIRFGFSFCLGDLEVVGVIVSLVNRGKTVWWAGFPRITSTAPANALCASNTNAHPASDTTSRARLWGKRAREIAGGDGIDHVVGVGG
jgi:hypothetical protein